MSLGQTLLRAGVQTSSLSPGPGLNQETTETPQNEEEVIEVIIKQEEEQLQVPGPESSALCVKRRASSRLQQRQGFSFQGRAGDIYETCSTDISAQGKKRTCPFCKNVYYSRGGLKRHLKVHMGDVPHSCSVYQKTFSRKDSLRSHMDTHAKIKKDEEAYGCLVCTKTFNCVSDLRTHMSVHSEDMPFSCSLCDRAFKRKPHLDAHVKWHQETQTLPHTGLVLVIVTPDSPVSTSTLPLNTEGPSDSLSKTI